jgi:2-oxoglutarate dehydrogenase E2 component (dihydrolipoamide succinyltransferase)
MEEGIKILLPKLGESIVSATIVRWFKNVGDRIERDEPLLEVSTDKVNSEIPSPVAGVLTQILGAADQEIQVGEALAVVGGEMKQEFLSPAVKRLLEEKHISNTAPIPRTGENGRLTKKDVESYSPASDDRVKMSPMRKTIAENMVKSFTQAPPGSLVYEVDVTNIVQFLAKEREKHGVKLSITPFLARAIAQSLEAYPLLNASIEGDTILMKRNINLGIAVSVEQGVIVPVLREMQTKSLLEIAKGISQLAEKARNKNLSPQDVQEGTITLTNFGMTGALIGIPIIRHPEVAIVGAGAIVKKVVALPDDSMAIRSMLMISLTFDHRIVDGIYSCGFMSQIKQRLEAPVCL